MLVLTVAAHVTGKKCNVGMNVIATSKRRSLQKRSSCEKRQFRLEENRPRVIGLRDVFLSGGVET